jgi:hypothetical protein
VSWNLRSLRPANRTATITTICTIDLINDTEFFTTPHTLSASPGFGWVASGIRHGGVSQREYKKTASLAAPTLELQRRICPLLLLRQLSRLNPNGLEETEEGEENCSTYLKAVLSAEIV